MLQGTKKKVDSFFQGNFTPSIYTGDEMKIETMLLLEVQQNLTSQISIRHVTSIRDSKDSQLCFYDKGQVCNLKKLV